MKIRQILLLAAVVAASGAAADAAEKIALPVPAVTGGMPFMEVLKARRTGREFDPARALTQQQLSELLYAAYGANRESGQKTVPAARALYDLTLYVFDRDGVWRYDPVEHALIEVVKQDRRSLCGPQKFHGDAAAVLVYVTDLDKLSGIPEAARREYANTHVGFSIQNVYLYAANAGLETVVCGMVNREELAELLKLGPRESVLYVQPVGLPVKK